MRTTVYETFFFLQQKDINNNKQDDVNASVLSIYIQYRVRIEKKNRYLREQTSGKRVQITVQIHKGTEILSNFQKYAYNRNSLAQFYSIKTNSFYDFFSHIYRDLRFP